jgi:hypothetical protein
LQQCLARVANGAARTGCRRLTRVRETIMSDSREWLADGVCRISAARAPLPPSPCQTRNCTRRGPEDEVSITKRLPPREQRARGACARAQINTHPKRARLSACLPASHLGGSRARLCIDGLISARGAAATPCTQTRAGACFFFCSGHGEELDAEYGRLFWGRGGAAGGGGVSVMAGCLRWPLFFRVGDWNMFT